MLAAAMFGLRDAIMTTREHRTHQIAPAPEPSAPSGPLVEFDPDHPGPVHVTLTKDTP
jgi:hypothetical protein